MAKTNSVWGIDIGQCAMKALRCRAHEDTDKIAVEAFDFIEYPQILTQPDANPAELIAEALKQFLSRNAVRGDCVAISVSGQSGLARFIKLPPVEAKKIPDIVRYEAKQQIPFDLNDVIWDYQRMGGGAEEEGFVLETEIGLFAMKRDAVFRAIEPFQDAGIEVDIVQLAPLALYNYLLFDQLTDLPSAEDYDPENPPESIVLVSLGTDATDLVVTNGFRVWQRSVPIGGSHFTRALTKELKLTFPKAEHLKRNATTAQDPKAVFQAMRPVFNDFQTELQRSLGYFTNIDRAAKIGRVLALGNAFKLPGLRRYLSQSLGFELERVESYRGLVGPEVLATPAFKENVLSFGVCYGLAVQALGRGGLKTNLLPRQIVYDRLISEKKPWAVAAAALVMLGLTINYAAYSIQFSSVKETTWKTAENAAKTVASRSTNLKSQSEEALKKFNETKVIGEHLVSNVEGRTRWLELLNAINGCLPKDDPKTAGKEIPIEQRNQVQVTNIDSQQVDDVAKWFAGVKQYYNPGKSGQTPPAGAAPAEVPAAGAQPAEGQAGAPAEEGPTGEGVIVQLYGHHYHNGRTVREEGAEYVEKHLLAALTGKQMQDLGVSYPVLLRPGGIYEEVITPPSAGRPTGGPGGPGLVGFGVRPETPDPAAAKPLKLQRFDFRIQFIWKYQSPSKRNSGPEGKPNSVAGG